MFVYEIIKRFEPHLYATLTVFRKMIIIVISVIVYKHSVSYVQIGGLLIIFSGLIYEIYTQFKPEKK